MPLPSFLAALISWRDVPKRTAMCWSRDLVRWTKEGIACGFGIYGDDADIGRSRSFVAEDFMRNTRHEVLVMIDHDSEWAAGSVERLVESCGKTRGCVGAVVPKRGFGMGVASFAEDYSDLPFGDDKLVPAAHTGAAFCAIHRDALLATAAHAPTCAGHGGLDAYTGWFLQGTEPIEGTDLLKWLSEDYAFGKRCKDAKVPLHIDCLPMVGHAGSHTFTVADAMMGGGKGA